MRLTCLSRQSDSIPNFVQIGRRDHFFDLGGTSLSGLKLAIALNRAVSFKDLNAHPIFSDQAALIAERIKRGVLAAPASVPSSPVRGTMTSALRGKLRE